MAEITLRGVAKRFGKKEAVAGLSFNVASGELLCLLAPPGHGKTTTLRLIAGLETPDEGEIAIDGTSVTAIPAGERNIAMVFEDLALYPHRTGFENIAHPLRLRRLPANEIQQRVAKVADLLGIAHILDRLPHTFSGGEQQRVAIARAIVRDPKILLLDQPLSNVDAKVREMMIGELRHLQQRTRQTAIYATHDYEEAMALADRILVLQHGRAEQVGTPEEVYVSPATTFVATTVGSPPMNLIPAEIRDGTAWADGLTVAVTGTAGGISLGFRPEDVRLGEGIEATVDLVQPLGRKSILDLVAGRVRFKAVVRGDIRTERGTRVRAAVDPQAIRIYGTDGRLSRASAVGSLRES